MQWRIDTFGYTCLSIAIEALQIRGVHWDFSLLRNPPSNVSMQSA
jgi:hypothetical protein